MMVRKQSRREKLVYVVGVVGVLLCGHLFVSQLSSDEITSHSRVLTESLNSTSTCTKQGEKANHGKIGLYLFALLYCFTALAIVCDDFFVASLEKITVALNLSTDVAGATFMAAGSSAPELFVSLADNVFQKPGKSLGIGTIVGSAIFNILIIIASSALLSEHALALDWRPMLRDSIWYIYSVLLLAMVIWDKQVDMIESLILFISYLAYILYMSQNEKIINSCWCCQKKDLEDEPHVKLEDGKLPNPSTEVEMIPQRKAIKNTDEAQKGEKVDSTRKRERCWTMDVESVKNVDQQINRRNSDPSVLKACFTLHGSEEELLQHKINPIHLSKYRFFQHNPHLIKREKPRLSISEELREIASNAEKSPGPLDKEVDDDMEMSGYFEELFDFPRSGVASQALFILTWPCVVLMKLTIPDCRFEVFGGNKGFVSCFMMSILWIGILSHLIVKLVVIVGCFMGLPFPLMGLTILAAGTSIPDALSSVLVARSGHGDMAVSNAIGSNVFDILLGLGFPFFLSNCVYRAPVLVSTHDFAFSLIMLLSVVVFVIVLLSLSGWKLHNYVGGLLLLVYAIYVVIAYLEAISNN